MNSLQNGDDVCNSNRNRRRRELAGYSCDPCPAGKYKASAGLQPCTEMTTSSCAPGFGFSIPHSQSTDGLTDSTADNGKCSLCAQGKYKAFGPTYTVKSGDTL